MRKYNNYVIIGVDAGYGNMKTARTIYPTGLVAMDTRPFDGDILEMDGKWYRIGEGHKAFNPDKTADEDFYILTLASIASELSVDQLTEANVHLAVGLPTTWTGRQREDYRNYMLRSRMCISPSMTCLIAFIWWIAAFSHRGTPLWFH